MAFCYQRRARLYLTLNRYPVLLVSVSSVTEITHLSRLRGTTGNLCRAGTVARNRVSLQKGCARLCGGRTCPVQAVDRERRARAAPLTRPSSPHHTLPLPSSLGHAVNCGRGARAAPLTRDLRTAHVLPAGQVDEQGEHVLRVPPRLRTTQGGGGSNE